MPKEKKEMNLIVQASSPEVLIAKAIENKLPVETMSKLMDLQDRWEAKQAKKSFDEAMAKLQGELGTIKKTKDAKDNFGKKLYSYAPLESIVEQTKEVTQRNGFSYMIKTEMPGDKVKVICIVKHAMGHSEETTIEMPLANRTNIMSAPQQMAATLTFAKRYAFCNAFGIMTGDEDTDAQPERSKPARKKEVQEVEYMDVQDEMEKPNDDNKVYQERMIAMAWKRVTGIKETSAKDYKASIKRLTSLEYVPENYEEILKWLSNTIADSEQK